jgi:hypothetical protein
MSSIQNGLLKPAHLAQRGIGLRRYEGFGDLASLPVLPWGKRALDEEARQLTALLDSMVALRSVGRAESARRDDRCRFAGLPCLVPVGHFVRGRGAEPFMTRRSASFITFILRFTESGRDRD